MVRPSNSGFVLAILAVIGTMLALPAHSQQHAKPDSTGQLEDIIVTATKRSSTVQETPMAITAVTGADILERGLADFTDVARSVPGVSMRSSGPGQTEFAMRGMTSAGGNSSTVGFYYDETALTAPANAQNGKVTIDPNLYDLSRIEVLRGPQGTLYGAGSMGGTIKVVPNAPDPHAFDASAQAVLSDTSGGGVNHLENAMVNVPLGSTAALRIVGTHAHDSGWVDRIVIADGQFPYETNNLQTRGDVLSAPVATNHKGANDDGTDGARVSLLWKPIDKLTIAPGFFYQKVVANGLNQIDSNPGTYAHFQPFDTPEFYHDEFKLGTLNVQYSFESFDVLSATSHWTRNSTLAQDGNEQFQWAFSVPDAIFPFYVADGGIGPAVPTTLEYDPSKQTSEELRFTSTWNSKFNWIAGFYYAKFESCYCLTILFPGAVDIFGTANSITQVQTTAINQTAFFGEVSYRLTDKLKGTAGLRRYSYTSHVITDVSGFVTATGNDTVTHLEASENDSGVNPKFDLSYQVNTGLLLYGTVAKGFRPGGGNQPVPTTGSLGDVCEANLQANHGTTNFVPAPTQFAPDTVWSYEVGEKARTPDGHLTVNTAVYYEKWKGTQQYIPLPCGYPYTANSGDAEMYGTELEVAAVLLPGLTLSGNVSYTHAAFVVGGLEAGIVQGTRVQNSPDWTSSVGLSYRKKINNELSFTARAENQYVGTRTDATYTVNKLRPYDLTSVRLGVEGDRWTAVAFARNLFNQRVILSNAPQSNINIPTYNRQVVEQPRTVGIDVSYRFGN